MDRCRAKMRWERLLLWFMSVRAVSLRLIPSCRATIASSAVETSRRVASGQPKLGTPAGMHGKYAFVVGLPLLPSPERKWILQSPN
eukprot:3816626-Amphidinium_carterae.1